MPGKRGHLKTGQNSPPLRLCKITKNEIYECVEDFYTATGWQRDNPEESSLPYLLEHKILIQIQEKLLYFSRIKYEDGLKKLDGQNGSQNAMELQQR